MSDAPSQPSIAEEAPTPAHSGNQPWRLSGLVTFGISSLAFGAGLFASTVVVSVYAVYRLAIEKHHPKELAEMLVGDGFALSLGLVVSAPVTLAVLFVALRLGRLSSKSALALNPVRVPSLLLWLAVAIGTMFALGAAYDALGLDFGDRVVTGQYCTARVPWLFIGAVVLLAPIAEELLVRGLMLSGFSTTRIRPIGAVLVTSLAWTSLHIQYEAPVWVGLFVLGMVLGLARLKTGSVYTTLAMHVAWNSVATFSAASLLDTYEGSCDRRSSVRIVTDAEPNIFPAEWSSFTPELVPLAESDRAAAFERVKATLAPYPASLLRRSLRVVYIGDSLILRGRETPSTRGLKKIYVALHGRDADLEGLLHFRLAAILFEKHRKRFPKESSIRLSTIAQLVMLHDDLELAEPEFRDDVRRVESFYRELGIELPDLKSRERH